MEEIYVIQNVVKKNLENKPFTRNSDMKLYAEVCNDINPKVQIIGLFEAMNNFAELGIPKFETVRRARQKIQADNPHLKASTAVQNARLENEFVVKEYAVS